MAGIGLKQSCNTGMGKYIGVASVLVCGANTPGERYSHHGSRAGCLLKERKIRNCRCDGNIPGERRFGREFGIIGWCPRRASERSGNEFGSGGDAGRMGGVDTGRNETEAKAAVSIGENRCQREVLVSRRGAWKLQLIQLGPG
jgi:hypothetical protein